MEKEATERRKLNISIWWSEVPEGKKKIMLAKTINRKTGYEEDNSHENVSVSFGTRWRVTCFPDKIEVIKMNEEKFRRVTKVWNSCSGW